MMGLLMHAEVWPGLRLGAPADYRTALPKATQPKTIRMGIYGFGNRRLGTSTSTFTPQPDGSVRVRGVTELSLGFLDGRRKRLTALTTFKATSEIMVSAQYRLQTFHMVVESPLFPVELRGVVDGEELVFHFRSGSRSHTTRIPFDAETPLVDTMGPMWAARNLRVGRQWQINALDPRDLTVRQARVQVVGVGRRLWRGRSVPTFKLFISHAGTRMEAEVTEDGELLEQTISYPLRLRLVREALVPQASGEGP